VLQSILWRNDLTAWLWPLNDSEGQPRSLPQWNQLVTESTGQYILPVAKISRKSTQRFLWGYTQTEWQTSRPDPITSALAEVIIDLRVGYPQPHPSPGDAAAAAAAIAAGASTRVTSVQHVAKHIINAIIQYCGRQQHKPQTRRRPDIGCVERPPTTTNLLPYWGCHKQFINDQRQTSHSKLNWARPGEQTPLDATPPIFMLLAQASYEQQANS